MYLYKVTGNLSTWCTWLVYFGANLYRATLRKIALVQHSMNNLQKTTDNTE